MSIYSSRWIVLHYRVDVDGVGRQLPRYAAAEVQHPDERERQHGGRQQLRGHHHRQRGHPEAGAALHRHDGASSPPPPPRCRLRRDRYHHHSRLPLRAAATARWHIYRWHRGECHNFMGGCPGGGSKAGVYVKHGQVGDTEKNWVWTGCAVSACAWD